MCVPELICVKQLLKDGSCVSECWSGCDDNNLSLFNTMLVEHEVYTKICKANKPKSGVPGRHPITLINEFGTEIYKNL